MYPPLRQRFLRNDQFGHSHCIALVPGVHDLCRYPTSFVQIPYIICVGCVLRDLFLKAYYIHEMYPLCHIKLFQRLILFGIMFLIKGGIYTNNVPPLCGKDSCETTNLVIPAALCLSQGCTICVDTLHYLCRYPTSFVQGVF